MTEEKVKISTADEMFNVADKNSKKYILPAYIVDSISYEIQNLSQAGFMSLNISFNKVNFLMEGILQKDWISGFYETNKLDAFPLSKKHIFQAFVEAVQNTFRPYKYYVNSYDDFQLIIEWNNRPLKAVAH